MTQTLCVTGTTGFIGTHLLNLLRPHADVRLRLLVRAGHCGFNYRGDNITAVEGDMRDAGSLEGLLRPRCTVINLAYLQSPSENLLATENLLQACIRGRAKRLVHCSTAVVVGAVTDNDITEETRCTPRSAYEVAKYEVETRLLEGAKGHFELAVLRPTAVFGKGGRNLIKLANDLRSRPVWVNYLKSCLFGIRRMNLVNVENVAAALVFLAETDTQLKGEIFIASDDDNNNNNYRYVEQYLVERLGCRRSRLPLIRVPDALLSSILRLADRSNVNPRRVYHSRKLSAFGFHKPASFESGLQAFTEWYRGEFMATDKGHE